MALRINEWNTYATLGYTFDVANDPRSQGGVHHHQVRHWLGRGWEHRIVQSNGRHVAIGPVEPMSESDGTRAFQKAQVAARLPDHG